MQTTKRRTEMSDKITKSPQIRFAGFTDAWEQRKINELGKVFIGLVTTMTKNYREVGTLLIRNSDIKENRFEFADNPIHLEEGFAEKNMTRRLYVGDVVTVHTGDIGTSAVITENEDGAIGFATINTRPNPEILDSKYLSTFFNTNQHKNFAIKMSTGDGRSNYNLKDFNNVIIPLPSLMEQKKIGTFFNKLDNLIPLHQRKLELLKETKKSLLQKMFPKDGVNVPEIRFAGFTDAWEQRELGNVVDVRSGRDYKHLSEGNIPVYGTGGYMLSVSEALSYDEDGIGIGRKGTIDKPYLLRAPFWTVDTLFYAVPKERYDLDFVHSVFQRVNWKQKDESTGVPSLSKTTITKVHVVVPEYEEQVKIGNFFKQLDDTITLHQHELNSLKSLKKSLLQQFFV